jgi:hypothetical protein
MKKLILSLFLLCATKATFAQFGGIATPMCALQSGDIKVLNGVTKLNVTFSYEGLGVGAYRNEADYLDKKAKEYNEKEKGDKFRASWEKAKTDKYPPHFMELFNKAGGKIGLIGKMNGTDADINLLVKTVFIEPGYNIGISKKPAFIDVEFIFTDKSGKELAKFFAKNAVGSQMSGFDFDTSSRVVESYGKVAKMLVGGIKKERKKAGKK